MTVNLTLHLDLQERSALEYAEFVAGSSSVGDHTCTQRTADPQTSLVIGVGPSVRPIHGSDEAIVSGG